MDLNGTWKLQDFDPGQGSALAPAAGLDDSAWLDAPVPGNVHSALVRAGRLPPPFYHLNLEQFGWVEDREWWYRRAFDWPGAAPGERQTLVCDGLDTLCTLYLNGERLGRHANMFVPARFDLTGRLRPGRNVLALGFDAVPAALAQSAAPPDQWTGRAPDRQLIRKAQCHWGWDWGPKVLTVGPWRGLAIERSGAVRLAGVHFHTTLLTAARDWAEAAVAVEVEGAAADLADLEVAITLTRGEQRWQTTTGVYGAGQASAALGLAAPQLWWTRDLGPQPLYDLHVELRRAGEVLDTWQSRVGVRTLTWDQAPDAAEPGTRFFTPVLNGVRVFAKGANWIPADSFLSDLDAARYGEWLTLAAEAGMNMLRVWGGGIYEADAFYDQCDALGLLVWQDFLYACALYPDGEADFCAEAEREARLAVRRLRNHPCLALWCGNNENDWLDDLHNWSTPGRDFPGKRLYHEVLPRVVAELCPGTFYWPSSPYGGDDHNDARQGDRHNWQVWHGSVYPRVFGQRPETRFTPEGVTYYHYAEDMGRFISEFGIHAAPVAATLRRSLPAEELVFGSAGLIYRNKDNPKDKGKHLMQAHTGQPADLAEYIDFSMITQAEGLKLGLEHYRRRKPHCSGTLVWQLNDCWPGISWSLADYYRAPKAGYFYVKRAYAPVCASIKPAGADYELWLVNDTLADFADEVTWGEGLLTGARLQAETLPVSVPANTAACVARLPGAALRGQPESSYLFVHAGQGGFPSNRLFRAEIKDLAWPPPAVQVAKRAVSASEVDVVLSSEAFVYFVKLECDVDGVRYSDNYLDLHPGRPATVRVWNVHGQPLAPDDITVSPLVS